MAKVQPTERKKKTTYPEGQGLILIALSTILLLSLLSFNAHSASTNWLGLVGWGIALGLNYLLGVCSYALPLFLGWIGWQLLLNRPQFPYLSKTLSFSLLVLSCATLFNVWAETGSSLNTLLAEKTYTESTFLDFPYPHHALRHNLGGVPLYYLYKDLPTFNLQRMLSDVGLTITCSITALVSFLMLTRLRPLPLIKSAGRGITALAQLIKRRKEEYVEEREYDLKSPSEIESALTRTLPPPLYSRKEELKIRTMNDKGEKEKKTTHEPLTQAPPKQRSLPKGGNCDLSRYQLPPPSLLANPKKIDQPSLKKDLKHQAEILEETLLSFGIEAKVGEINCGPTITSFEVHPAIGVKVQKIKTLENDIALNLQAKSIRIIAPIPGKAAVGVEIPSLYPQEVSFKELLLSYQQGSRKMMAPLLLGKSVSGDNVISDLAKMPHCLIAGATGSGKSVCINTIIMSILMNAKPDEVKLVMIDPKKVELTPYTHLPHMIAPVITEPHGAYAALSWLVKEMQLRYDILKQLGLRNITAFNNRKINVELEASLTIPIPEKMAVIVAIIDEFADLMMASSSDLETPIARIAQMARAVGIHLILATQRPSREVITGLIKANFPTRIAFKVASRINSQIILDDTGAENLLGNGDLLFLPPGTSSLMRAQGAYISDDEINRIVSYICEQAPPNYLIPSFDKMAPGDLPGLDGDDSPRDNLYQQALSMVIETKTASTTYLQRKLKIGYARAASLMDELETKGVISAQEGAKPRRILMDSKMSLPRQERSHESQEEFD